MAQSGKSRDDLAAIRRGWGVYSADAQQVGTVDAVEGGHVRTRKGDFFPTDLAVPRSAIARVERERVYLKAPMGEVAAQGWDAAITSAKADTGDRTLRLHEEELRATKERVQTGEVRLGKEVVEERKTVDVPVTHDEVYVERRPLDRRTDDSSIGEGESETVRVPVSEERVDVEKQTVLAEEVRVGTRPVTETRQVSDTVKREEARIEETGTVHGHDDTGGQAPEPSHPDAARDRRKRPAKP